MSTKHPHISIIIPCLNEGDFIESCINSLIQGNYPSELLEIIIVDGGSTDNTIKIVNSINKNGASIKILNNPKQIVPTALNIGVASSTYDIILLAGAHAIYDANYISQSVKTLLNEKCSSVGGVITPTARTFTGKAIAIGTSSKFGIGNAKYRYAKEKQESDTVFAGCMRKESINRIGGFNEAWVKNQDYEFNHRLRDKVGPIILDPQVKCQYFCRENISSLAKQYFSYGYWRFNTLKQHPNSFTVRQAAPLALFSALTISLVLLILNSNLGLIFPLFYLVSTIIASIWISISNNVLKYIVILPIIFITLHLSWAMGFVTNAFNTLKNKIIALV